MPHIEEFADENDAFKFRKNIDRLTYLLVRILILLIVLGSLMIFVVVPKIERMTASTEKFSDSVQDLTTELRPLLRASGEKGVEAIKNMGTEELTDTATEKAPHVLSAAADRFIRNLESDNKEEEKQDDE